MFDGLSIKQRRIVIIIMIIIIIIIGIYIYNKNSEYTEFSDDEILIQENESSEEIIEGEQEIYNEIVIHIAGEVNNPGIVRLKEGDRIEDAIEYAGGLTENADISDINLAYVLEDGIKINIPNINDENREVMTEDMIDNMKENEAENKEESDQKININKATQTELENLKGIGPSLSNKIIEYRNENGKFKSIEEIKNVNGIGDTKYEGIKNYITVK